jgi:hypothetical protein
VVWAQIVNVGAHWIALAIMIMKLIKGETFLEILSNYQLLKKIIIYAVNVLLQPVLRR